MKLDLPACDAKTYITRLACVVFSNKHPESKYLDFKDFKKYCKQNNLNPSHYTSLERYKKERGL